MAFLPKIITLLFCVLFYSVTAFAEDVIVKEIMPSQTGRLSTPADREKFAREHPRPPLSGQNPIPFRPAQGMEKYMADKAAAEALGKKRLHSRHQNSRLHEVNKKNNIEKENGVEQEDTTPESESAAALAKANALIRQAP